MCSFKELLIALSVCMNVWNVVVKGVDVCHI